MKIWVKKDASQFRASEYCPVCGRTDVNLTPFPFLMCDNDHPPTAMIRIRQKKGHFEPPKRRGIFR